MSKKAIPLFSFIQPTSTPIITRDATLFGQYRDVIFIAGSNVYISGLLAIGLVALFYVFVIKFRHSPQTLTVSQKVCRSGRYFLYYALVFTILFWSYKLLYANCGWLLDYGVSITQVCFNPLID